MKPLKALNTLKSFQHTIKSRRKRKSAYAIKSNILEYGVWNLEEITELLALLSISFGNVYAYKRIGDYFSGSIL